MSYLEQLRAKISQEPAKSGLTKPTKPGSVSFVRSQPAHSPQFFAANDDAEPGTNMPSLAAIRELDDLIARLCDARGWSASVRSEMLAARRRMSLDSVLKELSIIRQQVETGR